jgi:hypothetical protein
MPITPAIWVQSQAHALQLESNALLVNHQPLTKAYAKIASGLEVVGFDFLLNSKCYNPIQFALIFSIGNTLRLRELMTDNNHQRKDARFENEVIH